MLASHTPVLIVTYHRMNNNDITINRNYQHTKLPLNEGKATSFSI